MEGGDEEVGGKGGLEQQPLDPANLRHARQEDQEAALVLSERVPDLSHHRLFDAVVDRAEQVVGRDRKEPAFTGNGDGVLQQARDRRAIQRGRHDEQAQVRSEEPLGFSCEGQTQVRLQAALMELVEDYEAVSVE
ncbi:MAG: hypothetical protein UZ03_NOB001003648 [Nitrospira sp. OLB3]|nr:MAG: hypothetical protein UZ03_NOB001003648 [Nitrospira sp. OLB3]